MRKAGARGFEPLMEHWLHTDFNQNEMEAGVSMIPSVSVLTTEAKPRSQKFKKLPNLV
jgi:hypothetical protein